MTPEQIKEGCIALEAARDFLVRVTFVFIATALSAPRSGVGVADIQPKRSVVS